jgi:hypothetical protein
MRNIDAGVLFDQWRPDLRTEYIQHRSQFSAPMVEVSFDGTKLPDQLLMEYTKRVIITSKFKCDDRDFDRCNENAEYHILQLIMEPILKRANELRSAILNSDKYESIRIADEIHTICTKGQIGISKL